MVVSVNMLHTMFLFICLCTYIYIYAYHISHIYIYVYIYIYIRIPRICNEFLMGPPPPLSRLITFSLKFRGALSSETPILNP